MARIVRVLAPNPGPFTLDGTNTWVVGDRPALVIDPGPEAPGHVEAVIREAGAIAAILLTHHHPDHAPAAAEVAARSGAQVLAYRPARGQRRLSDGADVEGGGVTLRAVHTPGHTADHLVFFDRTSGSLFTGDAVLGRGTSVVDPPEGNLGAYLRSLHRMLAMAPSVIYPGHGPAVWSATDKLEEYLEHRLERERQVLEGLEGGPRSPVELVPGIYARYPQELHPAAARSVLAHLLKLEEEGRVARAPGPGGRFRLSQPVPCARCGRPTRPGTRLCPPCSLAVLQEGPQPGPPTT